MVRLRIGPKKQKTVILFLTVLLLLSAGGLIGRYFYLSYFSPAHSTVTVPNNLIREGTSDPEKNERLSKPETEDQWASDHSIGVTGASNSLQKDKPTAVKIELFDGKPGGNETFETNNMFPGDTETRYFCVKAYHHEELPLYFRTNVTAQTKALSEALHIKVTHMETDQTLYDATFSEINGKEVSELLKNSEDKVTDVYYQIDVSLSTSEGNEYQGAMLKADFEWFVKDEKSLIPSPQTGDSTNIALWGVLAASSLALTAFLLKRRKGERHG